MGIDLSLLPIKYKDNKPWLARDYLWFSRNYELFACFGGATDRVDNPQVIFPKPVDCEVWMYDDEGLDKTQEDAYGSPLTYFLAGEIRLIPGDIHYTSDWNRACIDMIRALPPDTPIVLLWH